MLTTRIDSGFVFHNSRTSIGAMKAEDFMAGETPWRTLAHDIVPVSANESNSHVIGRNLCHCALMWEASKIVQFPWTICLVIFVGVGNMYGSYPLFTQMQYRVNTQQTLMKTADHLVHALFKAGHRPREMKRAKAKTICHHFLPCLNATLMYCWFKKPPWHSQGGTGISTSFEYMWLQGTLQ